MSNINNTRYRTMLGVIAIAKFGILLFISIICVSKFMENSKVISSNSTNNMISMLIPAILILVFLIWSFFYIYIFRFKDMKIVPFVEDTIFMIMLYILILMSNTYESSYKYLFLFSIVSSTISLGKQYGMFISLVSSFIVLFIDLHFYNNGSVNIYFENDLLLTFGFVMIAWVLGEYKKFEHDQREMLETELKEQLRQHNYIEEMLLKNENCYNLLIEYSSYSILVYNNEGPLYVNQNALQLLGIQSLKEINFELLYSLCEVDDKKQWMNKYLSIINTKDLVYYEEKITTKDGKNLDIQTISTYCVYGKTSAILTIIRDITPEKQVQVLKNEVKENIKLLNESQEQNKFITEFFSNISHELKTPLNVIFSSTQLLNTFDDNMFIKNRGKYLNIMKQNCYRLMKLVNNLLDIIKYDAGFITPNIQNEDIIYMIETIAMSVVPYAESKGIELIFDTDIEEKIIAVDESKIERIFLNLISNALKFTDKGGQICVNITDMDDMIKISVKDTGIGIPPDKKDFIFGRFSQIDKTLKRNNEGTGIGLSLVKSFVELHNGKIELESKIGHGSEFRVILPCTKLEEPVIEKEIKDNIAERINMELSDI